MRTKGTPVDIKEEDIVSSIHDALQFVSYYHPRDFIPVEVRVVSAQGSEDELEREPVLLVPFNKYRSGTISFTQEFLEPGNFVGLVTVGNDRASVARFPFSVGAPRFSIWHYLGLGIAAVGAIFGFLLFGIKRRERIVAGNRA